MILLKRVQEPGELVAIREEEKARVRKIASPTSEQIGKKYRPFAGALRRAQYYKCCYCETWVQESYNDVEHFRPKARADRRPGSQETHGYWWLAWSWHNLLFSCPGCNRSGKNTRFPLAAQSVPLVAEDEPPGQEVPLCLHPQEGHGLDHIQFVHLNQESYRWSPVPRDGSLVGKTTIEVLELDRDDLLDLYATHIETLTDELKELRAALQDRDEIKITEEWRRALRQLKPNRQFLALTWDFLDQTFPSDLREQWGLLLPYPPIERV